MIVRICAWVGLALWVGGLALVAGIIAPAAFKILGKQEAGRLLGMLFPILDRWALVWGAVTVVSVLLLFMNRHFALRSLTLELPVGIMFALTFYVTVVLHPHIQDLKRKLELPEFQGTAHQQTIRFAFDRLHRRSVQLHLAIILLGFLSLGFSPRLLK